MPKGSTPSIINWDDIPWETTKSGKPSKKTKEALERVMNQRLAEKTISATKWDPVDVAGVMGLTVAYYYGMDVLEKLLPWKELMRLGFDLDVPTFNIKSIAEATDLLKEVFPHAAASYFNLLSGNLVGFQVEAAKTVLTTFKGTQEASIEQEIFELEKAKIITEKFKEIAESQGNTEKVTYYEAKIAEIEAKITEKEAIRDNEEERENEIIAQIAKKLPAIKIFTSLGLGVVTLNLSKEVSWSDLGKIVSEAIPL